MGQPDVYNKNWIRTKTLSGSYFLCFEIYENNAAGIWKQEVPMRTESLYYVMDYSGNYYRLNQADELVAAAGEQEATLFTFAQANRKICVGKKASFYCMVPIEEDAEKEDNGMSPVKELTYDEVAEEIEKNVSSYDLSEMDWAEYLTHFTYLVQGLSPYREELTKKLSDIDQKICDILHYVELCETKEDEAVDLVELLRVCRENRRDVKDEIQKIEYFQTNLGTNANEAKARLALKSMMGMETRKYKPRKFDELFENCILKEKRLQKKDVCGIHTYKTESKKQTGYIQHTYENKGGVTDMIQERNDTSFDRRENDWLAFARQQAEFYRNAGQYVSNLQMDINELDEAIEDILCQTEEANCNVAQGYKVFKRLKDLRLERKAKSQELACLRALTGFIDCDALADTCEASLAEIATIMGVSGQTDVANVQFVNLGVQENCVTEEIKDMVV